MGICASCFEEPATHVDGYVPRGKSDADTIQISATAATPEGLQDALALLKREAAAEQPVDLHQLAPEHLQVTAEAHQ